jgi:hypothetical protein
MVRPFLVLGGLGVIAYAVYIYRDPVGRLGAVTSIDEVEDNPERAKRTQKQYGLGYALLVGIIGLILLLGGLSRG